LPSMAVERLQDNPHLRTNHLLIIGIDKYQHHPPLNNARRDAETLRDILVDRYQFEEKHVTALLDEDATRRNILRTIRKVGEKLTPKDNLLIYFAGHGTMNVRKSQGFWIPVDAEKEEADFVANDRVRASIGDMEAHHVYLIVDACFSGSMIVRSTEKVAQLLEENPSRRVLTSGRKEAVSDGKVGNHSPFFAAVKHQLLNPLGTYLSCLDLENHVTHNTPRNAHQLPEANFIFGAGDQSGKFVFYPKRSEKDDFEQAKGSISKLNAFLIQYPYGKYSEVAFWERTLLKDTILAFDTYLEKYPRGSWVDQAKIKLKDAEEKAYYERIIQNRSLSDIRDYQERYPNGRYSQKIEKIRADELEILRIKEEKQKKIEENKRQATIAAKVKDEAKKKYLEEEARLKAEKTYREELIKETHQINSEKASQKEGKPEPTNSLIRYIPFGLVLLVLGILGITQFTGSNKPDSGESSPIQAGSTDTSTKEIPTPQMVEIVGGTFQMGSNDGYGREKPVHEVSLSTFEIGKYEVTVEEYLAFCRATDTHWPEWLEEGSVYHVETGTDSYYKDNGYQKAGSEKLPIVGVNWNDATAYAQWLSQETGQSYRLPTEAEWEYAAGGGKSNRTTYAGTHSKSALSGFAWYSFNSNSTPHPVGQKQPNTLGLYDMSGNVWEWCQDWYGDYPNGSHTDPQGPTSGEYRVIRGGSWLNDPRGCRVAFRFNGTPAYRGNYFGFRLSRHIEQSP
ncbi:MAG: SUMF1/EgtB/PvdO family nonheme iron enzyme, partial [Bacteroidota bacterium]